MGCLARVGCLIVLVLLGIIAWLTRGEWMGRVFPSHSAPASSAAPAPPAWKGLSDAGAARTKAALDQLSKPGGRVFETLSGSDVASYVFQAMESRMPASTDSVESEVDGDEIRIRASVEPGDVGPLGALGGALSGRTRAVLGGTLVVDRPGLAEFRVESASIHDVTVPKTMIPRILSLLVKGTRPAGVSAMGIAVPIPSYIGDIRVQGGKITLYKSIQ